MPNEQDMNSEAKDNLQKRYEITCPKCGKILYAERSIFHLLGMTDLGSGSCTDCHTLMRIKYDHDAQTMTAENY